MTLNRITEWFRAITPIAMVFLSIIGWLISGKISGIESDIKELKDMTFKHLTNDEMHSPRSMTVLKPEFTMYMNMVNQQLQGMSNEMVEIKNYIINKEIKLNRR